MPFRHTILSRTCLPFHHSGVLLFHRFSETSFSKYSSKIKVGGAAINCGFYYPRQIVAFSSRLINPAERERPFAASARDLFPPQSPVRSFPKSAPGPDNFQGSPEYSGAGAARQIPD